MTTKELIEILSSLNPEAEVILEDASGRWPITAVGEDFSSKDVPVFISSRGKDRGASL